MEEILVFNHPIMINSSLIVTAIVSFLACVMGILNVKYRKHDWQIVVGVIASFYTCVVHVLMIMEIIPSGTHCSGFFGRISVMVGYLGLFFWMFRLWERGK